MSNQNQIGLYQRLLAEDPTNTTARLRLAEIWRSINQPSRAITHYIAAARILADERHFTEALAACKAVLELDPTHTKAQLFMANLFARRPDFASSNSTRVVEVIELANPSRPDPDEDLIVLGPESAVEEIAEFDLVNAERALEEELRQTNEMFGLDRASSSAPDPFPDEKSVPYPSRVLQRALQLSVSIDDSDEDDETIKAAAVTRVAKPPVSEEIVVAKKTEITFPEDEDQAAIRGFPLFDGDERGSDATTLEVSIDELLSAEEAAELLNHDLELNDEDDDDEDDEPELIVASGPPSSQVLRTKRHPDAPVTLEPALQSIEVAELEVESPTPDPYSWSDLQTVIRPFSQAELEAVFGSADENDLFALEEIEDDDEIGGRSPTRVLQAITQSPAADPEPEARAADKPAKVTNTSAAPVSKPADQTKSTANGKLTRQESMTRKEASASGARYLAPRFPDPPVPRVKQTQRRMMPPVGLNPPPPPQDPPRSSTSSRPTRQFDPTPRVDGQSLTRSGSSNAIERRPGGEPPSNRMVYTRTEVISPASICISYVDLPPSQLLSPMSESTTTELLNRVTLRRVPAGETIITDEEPHRGLFLIVGGQVDVLRRNGDGTRTYLAELGPGEFFGEFQLLTGMSRRGLVRAANSVELLELHEDAIERIGKESPLVWRVLWSHYYERLLNNILAGSPIFRSLSVRERARVGSLFEEVDIETNQLVLRAGDYGGGVYLLLNGEMAVLAQTGDVEPVTTLNTGDFFGVLSAIHDAPCKADVRAMEETKLLFIGREDLMKVLQANPRVEETLIELLERSGPGNHGQFGVIKQKG